jgi:hypothetical protein
MAARGDTVSGEAFRIQAEGRRFAARPLKGRTDVRERVDRVVVSPDRRYWMGTATRPSPANRRAAANTQSGSPAIQPPP